MILRKLPFNPKNTLERRALNSLVNITWNKGYDIKTMAQLRKVLKDGTMKPGAGHGYGPKMHSILMQKAGLI